MTDSDGTVPVLGSEDLSPQQAGKRNQALELELIRIMPPLESARQDFESDQAAVLEAKEREATQGEIDALETSRGNSFQKLFKLEAQRQDINDEREKLLLLVIESFAPEEADPRIQSERKLAAIQSTLNRAYNPDLRAEYFPEENRAAGVSQEDMASFAALLDEPTPVEAPPAAVPLVAPAKEEVAAVEPEAIVEVVAEEEATPEDVAPPQEEELLVAEVTSEEAPQEPLSEELAISEEEIVFTDSVVWPEPEQVEETAPEEAETATPTVGELEGLDVDELSDLLDSLDTLEEEDEPLAEVQVSEEADELPLPAPTGSTPTQAPAPTLDVPLLRPRRGNLPVAPSHKRPDEHEEAAKRLQQEREAAVEAARLEQEEATTARLAEEAQAEKLRQAQAVAKAEAQEAQKEAARLQKEQEEAAKEQARLERSQAKLDERRLREAEKEAKEASKLLERSHREAAKKASAVPELPKPVKITPKQSLLGRLLGSRQETLVDERTLTQRTFERPAVMPEVQATPGFSPATDTLSEDLPVAPMPVQEEEIPRDFSIEAPVTRMRKKTKPKPNDFLRIIGEAPLEDELDEEEEEEIDYTLNLFTAVKQQEARTSGPTPPSGPKLMLQDLDDLELFGDAKMPLTPKPKVVDPNEITTERYASLLDELDDIDPEEVPEVVDFFKGGGGDDVVGDHAFFTDDEGEELPEDLGIELVDDDELEAQSLLPAPKLPTPPPAERRALPTQPHQHRNE